MLTHRQKTNQLGPRLTLVVLALALGLLLPAFGSVALAERIDGADHGGRPLMADLVGSTEVPNAGDPDGEGSAAVTLNQGQGEVCFDIRVSDIAPVTGAHIHVGAAGVSGPVVVSFDVPNKGLSGCVNADPGLIKAIRQNPAAYYVNVHNADFPAGAVRGQLAK
jgi:hypothetical protein